MHADPDQIAVVPRRSLARSAAHVLFIIVALLIALGALVAYEHYSVRGHSTSAMVCLVAAGAFGIWPIRALLRAFFAVEGRILHLVHGLGALGLIGLMYGGAVPGGAVLSHGAIAPFAIIGAAQAVMHQQHPRNAAQAAALQRFAASLREVEVFAHPRALASPANAARAVAVLNDLVSKAEILGNTELQADPGFQGALQQATTRVGLSLGLDAVDRAVDTLATNPAAAAAIPGLRQRLAKARKSAGV